MNQIILSILANPLFHLFGSSKELFHSNFWFWLSTLNKVEALNLFLNNHGIPQNSIYFKREHRQNNGNDSSQVDFLVMGNGVPWVVIENKLKDYPTAAQLDRIRASFNYNPNIHFVLVSLFPAPQAANWNWNPNDYQTLAQSINPNLFTNDPFKQDLINCYKDLCHNLSSLIPFLPITQFYDFPRAFNPNLFDQLNQVKLWEPYQKYRASHLIDQYQQGGYNIHNINFGYGVNRAKNAVINFELHLRDGYKIGVQLENNQFRKFISGPEHILFANNLVNAGLFFDNQITPPMTMLFLGYNPDFRYQYSLIPTNHPFGNLFNDINQIHNFIQNNYAAIDACIP